MAEFARVDALGQPPAFARPIRRRAGGDPRRLRRGIAPDQRGIAIPVDQVEYQHPVPQAMQIDRARLAVEPLLGGIIGDGDVVAAFVVVQVRNVQRHMHVADEMGEEGERLQPRRRAARAIGQDAAVANDLRGDAIAVRAIRGGVEYRRADRRVLEVPRRRVPPARGVGAHAIGPGAGVLQIGEAALRRGDLRGRAQQFGDRGAGARGRIGQSDARDQPVPGIAPGERRACRPQRQQRREQHGKAPDHAARPFSKRGITHSSA